MLTPYDGQRIGTTASTITFSGYHLYPSKWIRVMAFNHGTEQWTNVAETYSSASVSLVYGGTNEYSWQVGSTLASQFWRQGTAGSYARIWSQGLDGNNALADFISVRDDWYSCYAANSNPSDFSNHCKSADSPQSYIFTDDYACSAYAVRMRV